MNFLILKAESEEVKRMPFCNQCGYEHVEGARFCPKCGKPLTGNKSVDSVSALPESECSEHEASDAGGTVANDVSSASSIPIDFDSPMLPTTSARHKSLPVKYIAAVGAGGVAVVALLVLGAIFLFGTGGQGDLIIDESTFPNEIIRQAVLEQVDADGDGLLSAEEADAVTGLVYTHNTATFFLNGDEVSVSEEDAVVDNAARVTADDGVVEVGGSELAVVDAVPDVSLVGLEMLPNLRTLVARDAGIVELPTASLPSLEYIDCRNNPIDSIDLSNNANLLTMFCDPSVELIGLEKAGLYFSELLADITNSVSGEKLTVEYDTRGRPVRALSGFGLGK